MKQIEKTVRLTDWFDGAKHKPVRKGVYMLQSGDGRHLGYQYWDGERWGIWDSTPYGACSHRQYAASPAYQNDKWRGLTGKS